MAEKPDKELVSAYPTALVARVPSTKKTEKLSAQLVARHMGHLAVRVTFHKQPCVGYEVKLALAEDGGKPGAAVGEPLQTDKRGVARYDRLVPAGVYACTIEHQPTVLITTVTDPRKPLDVVTPVDRPFVDVDEAVEFVGEDVDDGDEDEDDEEDEDEAEEDDGAATAPADG